ncbi:hypothetical protein H9P43_000888 [Blastocladiella emersonii ATCC 22665]|nr:hypothetical protein H9P43_000888 [Blastocladiella emersonii ATCC 22665]
MPPLQRRVRAIIAKAQLKTLALAGRAAVLDSDRRLPPSPIEASKATPKELLEYLRRHGVVTARRPDEVSDPAAAELQDAAQILLLLAFIHEAAKQSVRVDAEVARHGQRAPGSAHVDEKLDQILAAIASLTGSVTVLQSQVGALTGAAVPSPATPKPTSASAPPPVPLKDATSASVPHDAASEPSSSAAAATDKHKQRTLDALHGFRHPRRDSAASISSNATTTDLGDLATAYRRLVLSSTSLPHRDSAVSVASSSRTIGRDSACFADTDTESEAGGSGAGLEKSRRRVTIDISPTQVLAMNAAAPVTAMTSTLDLASESAPRLAGASKLIPTPTSSPAPRSSTPAPAEVAEEKASVPESASSPVPVAPVPRKAVGAVARLIHQFESNKSPAPAPPSPAARPAPARRSSAVLKAAASILGTSPSSPSPSPSPSSSPSPAPAKTEPKSAPASSSVAFKPLPRTPTPTLAAKPAMRMLPRRPLRSSLSSSPSSSTTTIGGASSEDDSAYESSSTLSTPSFSSPVSRLLAADDHTLAPPVRTSSPFDLVAAGHALSGYRASPLATGSVTSLNPIMEEEEVDDREAEEAEEEVVVVQEVKEIVAPDMVDDDELELILERAYLDELLDMQRFALSDIEGLVTELDDDDDEEEEVDADTSDFDEEEGAVDSDDDFSDAMSVLSDSPDRDDQVHILAHEPELLHIGDSDDAMDGPSPIPASMQPAHAHSHARVRPAAVAEPSPRPTSWYLSEQATEARKGLPLDESRGEAYPWHVHPLERGNECCNMHSQIMSHRLPVSPFATKYQIAGKRTLPLPESPSSPRVNSAAKGTGGSKSVPASGRGNRASTMSTQSAPSGSAAARGSDKGFGTAATAKDGPAARGPGRRPWSTMSAPVTPPRSSAPTPQQQSSSPSPRSSTIQPSPPASTSPSTPRRGRRPRSAMGPSTPPAPIEPRARTTLLSAPLLPSMASAATANMYTPAAGPLISGASVATAHAHLVADSVSGPARRGSAMAPTRAAAGESGVMPAGRSSGAGYSAATATSSASVAALLGGGNGNDSQPSVPRRTSVSSYGAYRHVASVAVSPTAGSPRSAVDPSAGAAALAGRAAPTVTVRCR